MNRTQKFVLSAGGIFVFFLLFGILQEKITKGQYVNPDGSAEQFVYSTSLVFVYCLMNYVASVVLVKIQQKQEDSTPTLYYCVNALLYVLAMVCSMLALQFISYPTQVIAKSCKPVPVMIFGVLLGKKSYTFKKFIFVIIVVVGATLFLFKDSKDKPFKFEGLGIGELLVLSSLFMDGIIAAVQERMRSDYQTLSSCLMVNLNKWAALYLGILMILTNEISTFSSFIQRHPSVLWKLSLLSVCGFMGQYCMIATIIEFGTLVASIIATVRKIFTVVLSVMLLGNSLLPRQWVAAIMIFSGLFLDMLYGKADSKVK